MSKTDKRRRSLDPGIFKTLFFDLDNAIDEALDKMYWQEYEAANELLWTAQSKAEE